MATSFNSRLSTAPEEGCKAPCVTVSLTNITLSGEQTIGVTAVVTGDRVLVAGQTDSAENGIWVCNSSSWTRAKDWNTAEDVAPGMLIPVSATEELYQTKPFTGAYNPGVTEITFGVGILSARSVETQTGSQAVSGLFTLTTTTYTPGANNLEVDHNGQRLNITTDYTEPSASTVQIVPARVINADDIFTFRTNATVSNSVTVTTAISHTRGGVAHNLATYLDGFVMEFDTMADAIASTKVYEGAVLLIKDRANSHWDVVLSSGVTEDGYRIVQGVGVATLSFVLRTDGVEVTPMMFGAVGDGDGAGGGTNDYAACQAAFDWMRAADGRVLYGDAGKIYRCDTGITCQRSAVGDNKYLCFVGRNCKFDFSNIIATGNNMAVGATSQTYFAEQGGVFLGQFKILGCETGNTKTNTPVGDRTGLSLVYASRVILMDVYSNWNKVGVYTGFCFPLLCYGGSFRNNFIGHHAADSSNLQVWEAPTFNECRYGVVLQKLGLYGNGRIDNIVYNSPWLEDNLVPVTIDTSNDSGTPRIRRIKFNDGFYKGPTYDTFRMCMAFDFANPATRGADRTGQLYGMYINDGSQRGGAVSATSANLVFSSNSTVRNFHARMSIEETANSVINSPNVGSLTYTDDEGGGAFTQRMKTVYWNSKDYSEESWTPVLTFATPGNLSVAYSVQIGSITKTGRKVLATFRIDTSTFTHTTASGGLRITGLPYACRTLTNLRVSGTVAFSGITKATYTQVVPVAESGLTYLQFYASGSGVGISSVSAADMPTGGTVFLWGSIEYETTE